MIQITRVLAKQLRAVLRKSVVSGKIPLPVVFRTATYGTGQGVVEPPLESFSLPIQGVSPRQPSHRRGPDDRDQAGHQATSAGLGSEGHAPDVRAEQKEFSTQFRVTEVGQPTHPGDSAPQGRHP